MLLPYCLRIWRKSLIPLSRAQIGAAGSLPNAIEIEPFAAFCGTATINEDAADTSLTKICGLQPTRLTPLNACSENLPNAKMQSTFAFDAFSCAICGWTSEVVGSYPTFATIDFAFLP